MNNRFENKLCAICRARFTDKADVVVCPTCGTPHHRACYEIRGRCGLENLHESGYVWNGRLPDEPEPAQPENVFSQGGFAEKTNENSYENENPFIEIGGADDIFGSFVNKLGDESLGEDGVSMKELSTFAAKGIFHYCRAFELFRSNTEERKRRVFFNFASGFLAPAFQFYRKMDIFGIISMLITLFPFAVASFFPTFFTSTAAIYIFNLYKIAVFVLLSAFGDYFYYKYAVKSIKKFRTNFKGDTLSDEYFEALAEKGRPSVLRAIVGVLLLMLLTSGIMWATGTFPTPTEILGIF